MELEKWAPDVKKIVYKGGPNERKNIQQKHLKHIDFQVFLTTYEYVIRDNKPLSRVNWLYVIVDEGHRMKNVNSKLSMVLSTKYKFRYRLILTGTPLQVFYFIVYILNLIII